MNMLTERDKKLLKNIIFRCERIEKTINKFGNDYDIFINDTDYQDSVSMNILQIGETAGKLSAEYSKSTIHLMDWRAIKGMRNYFAHAYDSMDLDEIWETAVNDIPVLKQFCESEIYEISEDEDNGFDITM